MEIAQDGGCVPPLLSLMEASVPEVHISLRVIYLLPSHIYFSFLKILFKILIEAEYLMFS